MTHLGANMCAYSGIYIDPVTGKRKAYAVDGAHALFNVDGAVKNGWLVEGGQVDMKGAFIEPKKKTVKAGIRINMTDELITEEASLIIGLNDFNSSILENGDYTESDEEGDFSFMPSGALVTTTDRYQARKFKNVLEWMGYMQMRGFSLLLTDFVYTSRHNARPAYAPLKYIQAENGDRVPFDSDFVEFERDSNTQTQQVTYPLPDFKMLLDGNSLLQLRAAQGEDLVIEFNIHYFSASNVAPNGSLQIS